MHNLRSICILFLLALLATSLAYSQAVSGSLVGTLSDSSGAVIVNAKITITERDTGFTRSTTTNESGNYAFPDLPPGTYTVVAEQAGFKRASRGGVDVIVNTSQRVDLALQPGQVSETVDVTGEAPILQTERADTGRKIETKQLSDLPLGG